MPENLLCMQLSHIRYANMDFFKTPHIQIQLLGKDPVFKYEFLVLFIYPWATIRYVCATGMNNTYFVFSLLISRPALHTIGYTA